MEIVIVDQCGNALHEPVWTMASAGGPFGATNPHDGVRNYGNPGSINVMIELELTTIYGSNGSQDPANGYDHGTNAGVLIGASNLTVRAFDEQANTWSNLLVMDTK